jgi:hypothetical protein
MPGESAGGDAEHMAGISYSATRGSARPASQPQKTGLAATRRSALRLRD